MRFCSVCLATAIVGCVALRAAVEAPLLITNCLDMQMRHIEPGSFMMGSTRGDRDELPMRKINITQPFYMGVHEVTQAQWRAVMATDPSHFQGDDLPVEQVSWLDAKAFCAKLSKMDSHKYRLPTEAEWEYACRAGTTTEWYWGDDWDDTLSWVGPPTQGVTHPVGSKPANPWGLYDMIGNVWEWCDDRYAPYPRKPDPPAEGDLRVCRGGGAWAIWRYARCAARGNGPEDDRDYHLGFRVVMELE